MMRKVFALTLALLLLATTTHAADGEGAGAAYMKADYAPFFPQNTPLTPLPNLRGRTDSSGNLLVAGDITGSGQGPLTPMANLMVRTDSNGNLLVSMAGGVSAFPLGSASNPSITFATRTGDGFYSVASAQIGVSLGGSTQAMFYASGSLNVGANGGLTWSSSTDASGGADTCIDRASANQIGFLCGVAGTFIPAKVFVAANFTSAANTNLQAITGLSFTLPANKVTNVHLDCYGTYSIATAVVAVDFGVQDVTVAPTNALLSGSQWIATGSASPTIGTLIAFASTTATSVTSATPGAISTTYPWELHGMIEQPSNASTSVFQIMVKTANSADLPTVHRGSYCTIF